MGYIESMLLHDEVIIYTGRKHYALMLGQIITEIILLGLTGVAAWLGNQVLRQYDVTNMVFIYVLYGSLLLAALVLIGSAVIDYLRWYNDCVVLTNRRIMKFEGLFNRHMIESSLSKINDVALTQTFFGRVFGYGDIMILTVAETGIQEMRNIANPIGFKYALSEAQQYDKLQSQRLSAQSTMQVVEAVVDELQDQRDADTQHTHDPAPTHNHDRSPTPPTNVRPSEAEHSYEHEHAHEVEQPNEEVLQELLDDPRVPDHDETPYHAEPTADTDAPATEAPGNDPTPAQPTQASTTLLSQLEALHAAGILTDEEFATKRQQLLGEKA